MLLGGRERDAVRARDVLGEPPQLALRRQPKQAPGRVGDAGLALVGEVEVAVRGEVQIVEALEALAVGAAEQRLQLPRLRIEHQQPLLVAGDVGAPVLVKLEPVGPAVVLDDQLPILLRRDAENATEGNVHDPEVAVAVERGPFEEAFDLRALAVGIGPGSAPLLAELRRHRGIDLGLDLLQWLKRVEHQPSRPFSPAALMTLPHLAYSAFMY